MIYPHTQTDPIQRNIFAGQTFGSRFEDLLIVFPVRAIDQKGIGFLTADDPARIGNHFPNFEPDPFQHFIAIGIAETIVDDAEMVNINDDSIHIERFMILVKKFRIVEKVFAVIEICQRIAFRCLDGKPVFKQFNGSSDPGQDHTRLRIRLGDEIRSTQRQGFDL